MYIIINEIKLISLSTDDVVDAIECYRAVNNRFLETGGYMPPTLHCCNPTCNKLGTIYCTVCKIATYCDKVCLEQHAVLHGSSCARIAHLKPFEFKHPQFVMDTKDSKDEIIGLYSIYEKETHTLHTKYLRKNAVYPKYVECLENTPHIGDDWLSCAKNCYLCLNSLMKLPDN